MNKDISKYESNNHLPSFPKESSLAQSPPQPEYNVNKNLHQLRFSPLSPQPKFNEIQEGFEMNAKNFPSKVNVCKGQSPNSINQYSVHSNNSPIVQYYAGLTKSPIKDNLGRYSPDHQYKEDKPFYQINYQQNQAGTIPHNFNFSPSAIFNSYQKRSSNSSIEVNNTNSKPVPFISKTLQEKIEGHFTNKEDTEQKETNVNNIVKLKIKDNKSDEDDDISSEENQELYMLDFNSNEEDDDDDDGENPTQAKAKLDKKKNISENIKPSHNSNQNTTQSISVNNINTPHIISEQKNTNIVDNTCIISEQKNTNIVDNTSIIPSNNVNVNQNSNAILPNNTMIPNSNMISTILPYNTMIPNSKMISDNFNIANDDKQQIPIMPLKGKNKFDEANLAFCLNTGYNPSIGGTGLKINNDIIHMTTNTNNMNLNANIYYSTQMNNYYPYSPTDIQQQSYFEQSYYPNQKPMKEGPSFTYIEDQSSSYGEKKNIKKTKRLEPQSYVNQPYEELAKNICSLAKDQGGCRYLQKKFEEDPINITNAIYPAISIHLLKFINDPFGNYLIQKLFITLNESQIKEILNIISKNILDIGINSHGTRVIQQLINHLITPKLIELFGTIIKPFIVPLLNELNGTHIIQKFCNDYPTYGLNINLIIIDNCLALASHRHGCCVLQKYLETFERDLHLKLLDKLIANCLILVIDQFGNYVIQSIFYLGNVNASNAIALRLLDNICFYSKHKYSSNVVEKCFDYCDDLTRLKLIEVLSLPEAVTDLILDEHGNYVIQKVLACSHFKIQSTILQCIIPLFGKLQVLPFGEHIISRLLLSYPQLNGKVTGIDIKYFRGGKQGVGMNINTKYNNKRDNDNINPYYQGKGNNNKNYNKKNYKGYIKNSGLEEAYNSKGKHQQYK